MDSITAKRKFKCSFCGKEYDSATSRAQCELSCDKKMAEEIEKERQAELARVREKRAAEVQEAKKRYLELEKAYQDDYQTSLWCGVDTFKKEFPMLVFGGWPL